MPLRRKKPTVRESLEDRASVAAEYAGELGHKISEQAPVVRDQLVTGVTAATGEVLRRIPDLVDRLPDQVSDRLPDAVQPPRKKRRLRKVLVLGAVATAGGVAYSKVKGGGSRTTPSAYAPPPPASTTRPADVSPPVQRLADGAAPDVVQ